jgi:hypothetical protein
MALKVSRFTITPHLITIKCPSSLISLSSSYDCGEVIVNGIQKISGLLLFSQQYFIFQLYWWRKPEYPEKTTDLSPVTNKTLSHNVVSSTPRHERGSNSQL